MLETSRALLMHSRAELWAASELLLRDPVQQGRALSITSCSLHRHAAASLRVRGNVGQGQVVGYGDGVRVRLLVPTAA